jgi:hypothetical protein
MNLESELRRIEDELEASSDCEIEGEATGTFELSLDELNCVAGGYIKIIIDF